MEWVCNISLFLVFSGLLLELIADTKYYKFAKWVAGLILLLQFIQPFTEVETVWDKFMASFQSFDYAMGTDKVVEELYQIGEKTETSVLQNYKKVISEQITQLLQNSGIQVKQIQLEIKPTGEIDWLNIKAVYGEDKTIEILPVQLGEVIKQESFSPMELYVRDYLAEFYQMDKNKIEVVIQD